MELMKQPLNVESARLTAPPKGEDRLATGGRLLVVWKFLLYVSDLENSERYHLAFYHPDYGWHACRWDEKYGAPFDVYPISDTTIWVSTTRGELIHLSLQDEVRVTRLASWGEKFPILYATQDDLWVRELLHSRIVQLRLQANGVTIVKEKYADEYVSSMHPLEDGVWMIIENNQGYAIYSSTLEKMICKSKSEVFFYPPFLVRIGEKCCYYTEDPRRGWEKMPIGLEYMSDYILFFVKHDDICYAAVYRGLVNRTVLYRFSGESETDAERVCEISGYFDRNQFTMYGGLVCIADVMPLVVYGYEDMLENHGFLVWNPRSNIFFEDIPQLSFMHARCIIPHKLQVPAARLDREYEMSGKQL